MVTNNDNLDVQIDLLFQRDWVKIAQIAYYPPGGKTFYSVYLRVTNKSKKKIRTDLRKALLVDDKKAIGASMCLQARVWHIIDDEDPVQDIDPGDFIVRNLVYIIPLNHVPDAFVWKGKGMVKIPQTIPKKVQG